MDSEIAHLPEQSSEFYSEMSSCCCFLFRQLFLVQKTAHARGAARELRARVIVPCLSQGGHLFLNYSLSPYRLLIFREQMCCRKIESTKNRISLEELKKARNK